MAKRSTVYNAIVTEEKWEEVNQDNKDLLDEFIEYLRSTDKSELTIINYVSDIKICFMWSLDHNKNKSFIDFTKRDIMKYQNYLINTLCVSPSRVRRLRSTISSMSNFIENILDDDYPEFRNIVNKIPAPTNQAVREKSVFEDEEIQALLDKLVEEKQYQQACALALGWSSGARKSELLRFKKNYFCDENIVFGSLYKTPEKIKTKGRGKLGKQLHKFVLVNKFKPYLDLWLEQRKELGIDEMEDLFVAKRLNKWSPVKVSTLDSWSDSFTKFLGKPFYWHSLRHQFVTQLAISNIPDDVIKEIVGWENVAMVSTYKDISLEDKLGDYFGEDGIKQVEKKTLGDL